MLIPTVTTGQHNGFTFRLGIVHEGLNIMASNSPNIIILLCTCLSQDARKKNGKERHNLQTIVAYIRFNIPGVFRKILPLFDAVLYINHS